LSLGVILVGVWDFGHFSSSVTNYHISNSILCLNDSPKQQLFSNINEAMQGVLERVKINQVAHFYNADPACGAGVTNKLGIDFKISQKLIRNDTDGSD
jgi:catalase